MGLNKTDFVSILQLFYRYWQASSILSSASNEPGARYDCPGVYAQFSNGHNRPIWHPIIMENSIWLGIRFNSSICCEFLVLKMNLHQFTFHIHVSNIWHNFNTDTTTTPWYYCSCFNRVSQPPGIFPDPTPHFPVDFNFWTIL